MAGTLTVRELFTRWSFKADTKPIQNFDQAIAQVKRGVTVAAGVVGGLCTGIFALAQRTAASIGASNRFAQQLGISTESMQELQHVAERSGLAVEEMNAGVKVMSKNAYEASKGNKAFSQTFASLGVNVKDASGKLKDPLQLLYDIADGVQGVDNPAKRTAIAMQLFGDAGVKLVPLLSKGALGLAEMRGEAHKLGLTTDGEANKAALEFNKGMKGLRSSVEGVTVQVGSSLLPVVAKLVNRFAGWVAANRQVLQVKLKEYLGAFVDGLQRAVKWVSATVESMGGIKKIAVMVGVAWGVMTGAKMIMGFASVAKAVMVVARSMSLLKAAIASTGIGLLLVLAGYVYENWDKIKDQWRYMSKEADREWRSLVTTVRGALASAWQHVKDFVSGIGAAIAGIGRGIWQAISGGVQRAVSAASGALQGMWDSIRAGFWGIVDVVGGAFSAAWDHVAAFFGDIGVWLEALPGRIWDSITGAFGGAFEAVKARLLEFYEWAKAKLGKLWTWVAGEGGAGNIRVAVEQVRAQASAAQALVGGQTYAPAMLPAASPSGAAMRPVSIENVNNITVPPGTPATLAGRVAEATSGAMDTTWRRAVADVRR